MLPVYLDLHIHMSEDPNSKNTTYNLSLLDKNIREFIRSPDPFNQ
jgi:hypothetical protein